MACTDSLFRLLRGRTGRGPGGSRGRANEAPARTTVCPPFHHLQRSLSVFSAASAPGVVEPLLLPTDAFRAEFSSVEDIVVTLKRGRSSLHLAMAAVCHLAPLEAHRLRFIQLDGFVAFFSVFKSKKDEGEIGCNAAMALSHLAPYLSLPLPGDFEECCEAIIQTDGIKELVDAFHSSSQPEMQRKLAKALGQLCEHEIVRENFGQGPRDIFLLVQATKKALHDSGLQIAVFVLFANLACTRECKIVICNTGGIGCIFQAMQHHSGNASVQENGFLALRNIASIPQTQTQIAQEGGVKFVLTVMNDNANVVGLQVEGCLLLANLASGNEEVQRDITEGGGIAIVMRAMETHSIHKETIIALCNVGWGLRLSLDTIKELGGQEKIEEILGRDDVDETSLHWGNVLVDKLKYSGFQRGCLLDTDSEGRATGFSSHENTLGDGSAPSRERKVDSPRKADSATRILQHQRLLPTAPGSRGAVGAAEGRQTNASIFTTPGIPDVPLAPLDLDVGMAPSTQAKISIVSRPPSFNPLATPRGSVLSTPRGPLLSPRELSTSPLLLDLPEGGAVGMPGVRLDWLEETLSERNQNRWNLGSLAHNIRLVTPRLSSVSSSLSPASEASMVTADLGYEAATSSRIDQPRLSSPCGPVARSDASLDLSQASTTTTPRSPHTPQAGVSPKSMSFNRQRTDSYGGLEDTTGNA